MTERFNKTLTEMLSHYCNKQQRDWDRYLPYILYAYRTSPHSVTKYSPFYLLYGREAKYPLDTLVRESSTLNIEAMCDDESVRRYITELITTLQLARSTVIQQADKAKTAREKKNASMDMPHYLVGSKVMLYTPVVREKT